MTLDDEYVSVKEDEDEAKGKGKESKRVFGRKGKRERERSEG